MLSKDIFEASVLLWSHYPKRVSREIANTFNWKTTNYSWLKELFNPLSSPLHLYGGNYLPPQLAAIALFQHINPCSLSRSLVISLKFSVNITNPPRSWIMCKNIWQPDVWTKFSSIALPLTLHGFRRFYYISGDIYSSWISLIYRDKHGTFCLFSKMVMNKTILMAISLSNRSFPHEFNASIDCWLKTTSHYDVILPSTVSTTQNAKLLTSRNLCHSLMLCNVTRSQRMGDCETLRRPTRIGSAI